MEIPCETCSVPVETPNGNCPECGTVTRYWLCRCGADLRKEESIVRTYVSKSPKEYPDVECLGRYNEEGYFDPGQYISVPHHDLPDDSDRCVRCGGAV